MSKVKVICSVSGEKSRVCFVKICVKGNYDFEGFLPALKLDYATKFDLHDNDAEILCDFINKNYNQNFKVSVVEYSSDNLERNEYWNQPSVHGHFKHDRLFNGVRV